MMGNILFNIFLVLWTLIYGVIALPCLLFPPNVAIYCCYPWIYVILKALRLFCGIRYEIRGQENLSVKRRLILMSKHQSPLDTLLLSYITKRPLYVLKKELLWMPLLGLYLMATKMITIDRNSYTASFKKMVKNARKRLNEGRNIIIFPEGGRIAVKQYVKYQRGVSALYLDKKLRDVDFIPIALNCGVFWPFGLFDKKTPGTAIVKILPPISKSLARDEFMSTIQDIIDTTSAKLVVEGLDDLDCSTDSAAQSS